MKLAKALELRAILKRSARAALPIILLFILGVSLRIALYFPLAAFQLDSDAVIAGLCGFRVLDGSHPVFLPGGIRIGAASCYVAAAYFSLLGHGRIGLALTGLTWNLLYLASSFLFLKSAVSPRLLLPAFLFVVFPTEQFMTVSYAPWGYGEIMCVCAGTLWLAAEWRKKPQIITLLALGLAIGLGVWFSLQTIMITVPALAWVALQRRTAFFREALIAIPGVFVGALPFIMANVGHGFPTLTQNFYSQTVSNAAQAISNFVWFGTNLLPKLLFRFPASPDWIIMSVAFVLVAIGAAVALRKPANGKEGGLIDLLPLLVLTLVACTAIFSLSAAGIIRGWTVRYIAPLYLVIPIFYAIGLTRLWRWSKVGTATIAAALIIPNILTYGLPGSAQRSALTAELQADVRLRDRAVVVRGLSLGLPFQLRQPRTDRWRSLPAALRLLQIRGPSWRRACEMGTPRHLARCYDLEPSRTGARNHSEIRKPLDLYCREKDAKRSAVTFDTR
jgi:hypothetical protein